ncbi:YrhC family protein [Sediminibacillus albus]|uniref:YrhC-like protein n=1 Tax=Sediminibacillus albus TaxID=407036 RepID=A0A1G9CLY7_9BACI|nr:YrhC family protein [Sediminibacillus albus]SDK52495.1 YrhC-like protein [Sediminibacillus albus]
MNQEVKQIEQKIEDYTRFLKTLLMLSTFLYLGLIISYYLEPNGKGAIVCGLLIATVSLAGWFAALLRKWQRQLNQLME